MSTSLAYHRSPIQVSWRLNPLATAQDPADRQKINCLLLPWPFRILTRDFQKSTHPQIELAPNHGFFTYSRCSPGASSELDGYLRSVLTSAHREVGHIDMVVLPEAALCRDGPSQEINNLKNKLQEFNVDLFIAGFYQAPTRESAGFSQNGLLFGELEAHGNGHTYRAEDPPEQQQHKHHRWMLDRDQIRAYQLGSVLPPGQTWIENIEIRRRRVTILNALGITICPLICEDLARQDPVADLLRAIGPSLIVALLMDGPQYTDRWGSRYASVLADDPGSAVLTLAPVGMVRRWSGRRDRPHRNIVALWKSAEGPAVEIELEARAKAIILSLCIERRYEISADGRQGRAAVPQLNLFGVQQVMCDESIGHLGELGTPARPKNGDRVETTGC